MRRAPFLSVGVAAIVVALAAAACKTSSGEGDGGEEVPEVNSVCRSIPAVSSNAMCDGCTRDVCCLEVRACEGDVSCRGLIHCLADCERGAIECSDACKEKFPGGESGAFLEVNECAQKQCPVACGTAVCEGCDPDAGAPPAASM